MAEGTCLLFLFNGFADWEPAHITTALVKYSNFKISTFSVNGDAVTSMGNLRIIPEKNLETVLQEKFELLLLPGGDTWENNGNMEILPLITNCMQRGTTIAAICGATIMLGKAGIFSQCKHTSNGLDYLKANLPDYDGENHYVNEPAVVDHNIITANGAAMLEFSYAVFQHLKIFSQKDLTFWFNLYKSAGIIIGQK